MRGRLMRNVSLARMTTWGTGGSADRVYVPADVEDLADFLAGLDPRDEVLWVGLGSNLLVRDGGVAGVVILTARTLGRIEEPGGPLVRAGAGVPLRQARPLLRGKRVRRRRIPCRNPGHCRRGSRDERRGVRDGDLGPRAPGGEDDGPPRPAPLARAERVRGRIPECR